jgi:hypothetical protein
VGGGYPEAESGLAKLALEWMLDEAEPAGLIVEAAKRAEVLGQVAGAGYVAPDANADPHESLEGAWNLVEYLPKKHYDFATRTHGRRMNRGRRRTIPPRSLVHASAFERGDEYAKRLPPDAIRVERRAAPPSIPEVAASGSLTGNA